MVNYQNTKIYYIPVGANDRYYGHTTQPLCNRKAVHKADFKNHPNIKLYKTIKDAGLIESDIELIWVEDYPCERKEQALARERYYIEQYATLNTVLPCRTHTEYYEDNKIDIIQRKQLYYENNKEEILEKQKIYRVENAEKERERAAKYRIANAEKERERTKQWGSTRVICPHCNKDICKGWLSKHIKKQHNSS